MKLINADELIEKYGDYYVEEGSEKGFIGDLRSLVENELNAEADDVKNKSMNNLINRRLP